MAPEDLVIDFLNTVDAEAGTDEQRDLPAWAAWVGSRQEYADLPEPTTAGFALDRDLRAYLRAAAEGAPLSAAPEVGVVVDLGAGARLTGTTVAARVAAAVATLAAEGRWERVKICPADDCRWAFYDHSRNRSRQWCSMQVCGNRAKARTHRLRAGAG